MSKERFTNKITWRNVKTPTGLEYSQLVVGSGVPIDDFARALEAPQAEAYRAQTIEVLTEGWEQMAAVLSEGGMATGLGDVYTSLQLPMVLPPSLESLIEREGIYTGLAVHIDEEFFVGLQTDLDIGSTQQVNFIAAEFNKRMMFDANNGSFYRNQDNKPVSMNKLNYSFNSLFKILYAERNMPPIVASNSAVNSMLKYITSNEI